jgi:hypothetical protein
MIESPGGEATELRSNLHSGGIDLNVPDGTEYTLTNLKVLMVVKQWQIES